MHGKLLVLQSLPKKHSYALWRISSNHLQKRPSITNSREDFEEQKCKINIFVFHYHNRIREKVCLLG